MRFLFLAAILITALITPGLMAQQKAPVGYDHTPMPPNNKWHIHDPNRPQPRVVTPAAASAAPLPPPSDAIVLVGARADLSAWQMDDGSAATWLMSDVT